MREKLVLGRREAAAALMVSLPTLDGFLYRTEAPLPHLRAGRKVLIPVNGLQAWLRAESERRVNDHV